MRKWILIGLMVLMTFSTTQAQDLTESFDSTEKRSFCRKFDPLSHHFEPL